MLDLVSESDCRRVPWKNGGGTTVQIACAPGDADLDTFVWRVSVAEVASDGPFSAFTGVDRIIALVRGPGMRLESPAFGRRTFARPLEPRAFAGEDRVRCTLLGGPVRDFNLMVRRRVARGTVRPVLVPTAIAGVGQDAVLYGIEGGIEVRVHDSMPDRTGAVAVHRLGPGAALVGRIPPGTRLLIRPGRGAKALLASIEYRRSDDGHHEVKR